MDQDFFLLTVIRSFAIFQDMGLKFGRIREMLQSGIRKLKKEKRPSSEPAESVKAPKLSEEAYSLLEKLYDELGPRPAATAASRNAARKIGSIFETFSNDVTVTTGRIIPDIHRWMILSGAVVVLSMFLFSLIGLPYISFAIGLFFSFSVINELRLKKNPMRSFFPSDDAANVHAVIEPEGTVEHTVILSAHHDTAAVSDSEKEGLLSKLTIQTGAIGFIILSFLILLQILIELFNGKLFSFGLPHWSLLILQMVSVSWSVISFLLVYRKSGEAYTGGAGDNLSGVAVVATLGKYFAEKKKQGKGLEGTRLVFVSFDGEECGSEGSAIWYRDNSHILTDPVNINFDGLYNESDLAFLSSDGNGFVPLSSTLASKCSLLSIEMGYKIPTGKLGFLGGSTDAVSASVNGISATTLTSMACGKVLPVHTMDDTPDKVSKEALSIAMSVAIKYIEEIDCRDEYVEKKGMFFDDNRKYKLSRYQ